MGGVSLWVPVLFILLHPLVDLASLLWPLQPIRGVPSPFLVPFQRQFLPYFFGSDAQAPPPICEGYPHAPASLVSTPASVAAPLHPVVNEDPSSSLVMDINISFVPLAPSPSVKAPSPVVPVVACPLAPATVDSPLL
jgi:hypothetical protein